VKERIIQICRHPFFLVGVLLLSSIPFIGAYRHLGFSLENIWVVLFPFSIYVARKGERSLRLLWLVIPVLLFHILFHSSFGLYVALFLLVFILFESTLGKLNRSAVLILLLSTPAITYGFEVLSFPIRRLLSEGSVFLLNIFQSDYQAQGSLILGDGKLFSVDEACSGLKMVVSGFAIMFLWMAHVERKKRIQFKWLGISGLITITAMVIILGNLLRIVTLVAFQLPPENALHEWVGIGVIVFTYPFIVLAVNRAGRMRWLYEPWPSEPQESSTILIKKWQWPIVLFSAVYILWYTPGEVFNQDYLVGHLEYPGYQKRVVKSEVLELKARQTVIYIKPNKGPLRVDHHPMICWKGSGFELANMQRREVYGEQVYFGQLIREGEVLQTCWWYDNGTDKTTSQWEWRKQMFMGARDYKLVNVTSRTEEELLLEVGNMLRLSQNLVSQNHVQEL